MTRPERPPRSAASEESRYVRWLLLAALLMAAFVSLCRLDSPLQGSEGRWAAVTLEMLKSGDYFSMTIGGSPYPDKPFGSYWLIALVAKLTGTLAEWGTRLPGALSLVLATYVVFAIGKRTVGGLAGAVAACVFATTWRLVLFSRVASADPQTLLGVALAMLLILEASEDQKWWQLPALGVVMGVTSLMKGLGGAAVPCFAAFLWAVAVRGFAWIRPLPSILGALAFILTLGVPLAIPWLLRGDTGPLDLLWRESVTRGLTPFDHVQSWYFYFWNQFELLAPWSALLPAALLLGGIQVRQQLAARRGSILRIYERSEERRRFFPLFGYLAIFLLFTLSGSRRNYYLMPIAPFSSLLIAGALIECGPGWPTKLRKWGLTTLAVVGIVAGAVAFALGTLRLLHPHVAPPMLDRWGTLPAEYWQAIPVGVMLIGLAIPLAILLLKRLHDRLGALPPAIALAFVILAGVIGTTESMRAQARGLQEFCAELRQIVPAGEPVEIDWRNTDRPGTRLTNAPEVAFYLGRPLAKPGAPPARFLVLDNEEARQLLTQEPGVYTQRIIEKREAGADSAKAEAQRRVLLERVQ